MATQYRFKTVMVEDNDRSAFSALRDSFGVKVSDKELFSAIWNSMNVEDVKKEITEKKKSAAISKEKEKIQKLEKQLKEKLAKLQTNQTEAPEVNAQKKSKKTA
jgi:predicted phage tail protein